MWRKVCVRPTYFGEFRSRLQPRPSVSTNFQSMLSISILWKVACGYTKQAQRRCRAARRGPRVATFRPYRYEEQLCVPNVQRGFRDRYQCMLWGVKWPRPLCNKWYRGPVLQQRLYTEPYSKTQYRVLQQVYSKCKLLSRLLPGRDKTGRPERQVYASTWRPELWYLTLFSKLFPQVRAYRARSREHAIQQPSHRDPACELQKQLFPCSSLRAHKPQFLLPTYQKGKYGRKSQVLPRSRRRLTQVKCFRLIQRGRR